MTAHPLFSIIIPTYQRPNLLHQAVDSVRMQGLSKAEILVVDDDPSGGRLHLPSMVQYVRRPDTLPKGANACRNLGMEMAKGNYLIFLDDDDLLAPGLLARLERFLIKARPDVIIGDAERFGDASGNLAVAMPSLSQVVSGQAKWLLSASCWKREFLCNKHLAFDNDLQNSQEWLFHIRALLARPDLEIMDVLFTSIRVHRKNRSWQVNTNYLHHQAKARRKAAWALLSKGRIALAVQCLARGLRYRGAWLKHVFRPGSSHNLF